MFSKYFDSVFKLHQCSVSNERVVVMTTDAILLFKRISIFDHSFELIHSSRRTLNHPQDVVRCK